MQKQFTTWLSWCFAAAISVQVIALSDLIIEVWGLPYGRMFTQGSYKANPAASSSSGKHDAGPAGGNGRHGDGAPAGGADGSGGHGELPSNSIFLGAVTVSDLSAAGLCNITCMCVGVCTQHYVRLALTRRTAASCVQGACERGFLNFWVPLLPCRSPCCRRYRAPAQAAGSSSGTACSGALAASTSLETCRWDLLTSMRVQCN